MRRLIIIYVFISVVLQYNISLAETKYAYVWANQPTLASYVPSVIYLQEDDIDIRVSRLGIGYYNVTLASWLEQEGNIQVSSYGRRKIRCQLADRQKQNALIACFDLKGKPTDARFSVLAIGSDDTDIAYVWTGNSSFNYSPFISAQIKQTSRGRYQVNLSTSILTKKASIQVTPINKKPRTCVIEKWETGQANIICTDIKGALANTAFSLLALRAGSNKNNFSFVWANNPYSKNYQPSESYSHTPGKIPLVKKRDTGIYKVFMNRAVNNVQVTPYGSIIDAHCNPVIWTSSTIKVRCTNHLGEPIDSAFTLLATNRKPVPLKKNVKTAFAWADKPTTSRYTPPTAYLKQDDENVIIRRLKKGRYQVILGSLIETNGNVQVTAHGKNNIRCQIVAWSASGATIACFNLKGEPIDSRFSILAVNGTSDYNLAYVWANKAKAATYSPAAQYSHMPGIKPQIKRLSVGRYQVALPKVSTYRPFIFQVTAYGNLPRNCGIESWQTGKAIVICSSPEGKRSDSQFSLLVVRAMANNNKFSFVWTESKNGSYSPSATYSYTPKQIPYVKRLKRGHYKISMNPIIGNIQTTAIGQQADTIHCKPIRWDDNSALVRCFDHTGKTVDSDFSILATQAS